MDVSVSRYPRRAINVLHLSLIVQLMFVPSVFGLQMEFPSPPPAANADPARRHAAVVSVPTRLKITRHGTALFIALDPKGQKREALSVGANMVTGIRSELFVYPLGGSRPMHPGFSLRGGLEFEFEPQRFETGISDQTLTVEMVLEIFETDIPVQHEWSPTSGKFKVLWKGVLRSEVKP
jgi:hypothetical protein